MRRQSAPGSPLAVARRFRLEPKHWRQEPPVSRALKAAISPFARIQPLTPKQRCPPVQLIRRPPSARADIHRSAPARRPRARLSAYTKPKLTAGLDLEPRRARSLFRGAGADASRDIAAEFHAHVASRQLNPLHSLDIAFASIFRRRRSHRGKLRRRRAKKR